jgi:hypothetical protein
VVTGEQRSTGNHAKSTTELLLRVNASRIRSNSEEAPLGCHFAFNLGFSPTPQPSTSEESQGNKKHFTFCGILNRASSQQKEYYNYYRRL